MKNTFFKEKKKDGSFKKNLVSLLYAIIAALLIRSFLYEPFSIPSGSMYPNLKVGDYLFVSKFSYGFSKHSLPFSIPIIPGRLFSKEPERGEIVVFKTPEDNRTDYIKRVVGLPGDFLEMKDNILIINNKEISVTKKNVEKYKSFNVSKIIETLPNKLTYEVYEFEKALEGLNTNNFNKIKIPTDHFFVLGDNRDNSQDSRFIGLIPRENLVGRAEVVAVSFDTEIGSFLKFWTWYPALRKDRFFVSLIPQKKE